VAHTGIYVSANSEIAPSKGAQSIKLEPTMSETGLFASAQEWERFESDH